MRREMFLIILAIKKVRKTRTFWGILSRMPSPRETRGPGSPLYFPQEAGRCRFDP
jgi:hypothetical protein